MWGSRRPAAPSQPMTYVNQIRLTVGNTHNLLTKRLYEYIHRAAKRIRESEVSVFYCRQGQFICADHTLFKVSAVLAPAADIAEASFRS